MELSLEEKKAIEQIKYQIYDSDGNRVSYIDISDAWIDECSKFISAIEIVLSLIDKQQKEIEEKTTILLAGAEKVKQLEKGNRSLMESRIKWKNRYYKEKAKNKEYISKDKIREKIKELEEQFKKYENEGLSGFVSKIDKGTRIEVLKELLEEN